MWSFSSRSLSMVFGTWKQRRSSAGARRFLAHDATGVGAIVAADIEEIADVVAAAAVEDLLARASSGLSRVEPSAADGVDASHSSRSAGMEMRSTSPSSPHLTIPRTPWRMPKMRLTLPLAPRPVFRPSTTPTSD